MPGSCETENNYLPQLSQVLKVVRPKLPSCMAMHKRLNSNFSFLICKTELIFSAGGFYETVHLKSLADNGPFVLFVLWLIWVRSISKGSQFRESGTRPPLLAYEIGKIDEKRLAYRKTPNSYQINWGMQVYTCPFFPWIEASILSQVSGAKSSLVSSVAKWMVQVLLRFKNP